MLIRQKKSARISKVVSDPLDQTQIQVWHKLTWPQQHHYKRRDPEFFFFFLGGRGGCGGEEWVLSLMHSEPSYDPFNSISFWYESWTREKPTFGLLLGKWNKKKWTKLLSIKFESIIQESLKKLTPLWNIIFFF